MVDVRNLYRRYVQFSDGTMLQCAENLLRKIKNKKDIIIHNNIMKM